MVYAQCWRLVDAWRRSADVVFLAGIIALVIWGITRFTKHDRSTTRQSPMDIAKERYAKGEITKEQFEQIRKDLSQMSSWQ